MSADKTVRRRYSEALNFMSEGKLPDSAAAMEEILKDAPDFLDAYEGLAAVRIRMGKLTEAAQSLQDLIALNPQSAMGHAQLSIVYMKMGFKEKAEEEKAKATVLRFHPQADAATLERAARDAVRPSVRKWKLIVFDFDGTLVDTAPDIADCANEALAEKGFRPRGLAEVKTAIGSGVRELMKQLAGIASAEDPVLAGLVDRFRELYACHLTRKSRPYSGVTAALEGPLAGTAKAIVTNKPHDLTERILGEMNLSRHFHPVIGTGKEYAPKPWPDAVLAVMKHHSAAKADTILVGDSGVDAETAHAAGISFGWVNYGYDGRPAGHLEYEFKEPSQWKVLAGIAG